MAYTTIKKPSDYFNTKLYTGNGTGQSITGVNFQPDFVWTKRRNTIGQHFLQNIVQGTNKALFSDSNSTEFTGGVDGGTSVTSFDSDGFTLGTEGGINGNNDTFVSWNWLADNTSGSSNTDGSITSTVSANTTSGFSIVSYTGTGSSGTVGHGLGSTPSVIWVKSRNTDQDWFCHWSVAGDNTFLKLNSSQAVGTNATAFPWNPQTDTFGLSSDNATNQNTTNYIAYCFAEKKGFSKFGSYTGNSSTDGSFVYLGFKPAMIIIKQTNDIRDWYIFDNKRNTSNVVDKWLDANTSDVEGTFTFLDITSNGFKLRTTDASVNTSSGSYIYMAFAEEPLVGDNPATAR